MRSENGVPGPKEVTRVERSGYSTAPSGALRVRPVTAAAHAFEAPPLVAPVSYGPLAAVRAAAPISALEQRLAEAERVAERNDHVGALQQLDELWSDVRHEPALALRHRLAASWAEMYAGRLDRAAELLAQAESVTNAPTVDAAERAEVLYRLGCIALKTADVAEAIALFTRALETNQRSARPSDLLTAHVLEWRSRCYQFGRDWGAALRDAERSLELATSLGDELAQAHALFQASNVAERQRQWLLARCYAEQALELYRKHGDVRATAKILNNLGGIDFLLGNVDAAERTLEDAAMAAAEAGSDADVAQAVSSLAQVFLRTGRAQEARVRAQRAVEILEGRPDYLDELGNAQLIVAKALAEEGDAANATGWLDSAEHSFTTLGSTSHLAMTWVARGDLARSGGEVETAAELYRNAAEALQDWHF
jgi:tetratricopeptide (TPR) repeat protein